MKINVSKIGGALAFAAICACGDYSSAQTTTVTETGPTTVGTVTEFTPASETLILKSETSAEPLHYTITKETTIVDESGAPVAVEKVTSGLPITVRYTKDGDRLVASRIIVQKAPPTVEEHTTTTETGEDRPLTHEEKKQLHQEKEHPGREEKKLEERDK